MLTIIDLKAELGKLNILHGRRPEMTEADRKGSGAFATLAPFRDGNIFSAKFAGDGAWERHPNGDELVQVVDGSTTLHIITEDGPQSHTLSSGMVVIVPQGAWHRFHSPEGVSLVTATPTAGTAIAQNPPSLKTCDSNTPRMAKRAIPTTDATSPKKIATAIQPRSPRVSCHRRRSKYITA